MGTITLLNKNSDTSEIAVSKFFTNYSQKLSLISLDENINSENQEISTVLSGEFVDSEKVSSKKETSPQYIQKDVAHHFSSLLC